MDTQKKKSENWVRSVESGVSRRQFFIYVYICSPKVTVPTVATRWRLLKLSNFMVCCCRPLTLVSPSQLNTFLLYKCVFLLFLLSTLKYCCYCCSVVVSRLSARVRRVDCTWKSKLQLATSRTTCDGAVRLWVQGKRNNNNNNNSVETNEHYE